MKESFQKKNGITLIALVITIVVLIILAAVSISLLTGEDGIITQAKNSKERSEIGEEKEWISLSCMTLISEQRKINAINLEQKIKQESNREVEVNGEEFLTVIYKDTKRKYKVDPSKGTIIEDGKLKRDILLSIYKNTNIVINGTVDLVLNIDLSQFDIYEEIDYYEFSKKVVKNKSDEEKEKMVLNGASYWDLQYGEIEEPYSSLEELFQTIYQRGWTDSLCTSVEDLCDDWEYDSIDDLIIDNGFARPDMYNFNTGMGIVDDIEITVINPDGEEVILKNEFQHIYEATQNGTYSFTVKFDGEKADISTDVNNIRYIGNISKHPEQTESDAIGVDENGQPVNMDLWKYYKYESYYDLTDSTLDWYGNIAVGDYAYKGTYIDGKIQGNVPMAIKESDSEEFLPVEAMSATFAGATGLKYAPKIPDTVKNMKNTFYECTELIQLENLPSKVMSFEYAFYGCSSLVQMPEIPNSVNYMYYTFYGCSSLIYVAQIPNRVRDMSYAFYGCTSLKQPPIIQEGVTDMYFAFYECTSLEQAPVIPNSVEIMIGTFEGCTSLKQAPVIPNSVKCMSYIFKGCESLTGELIINTDARDDNGHYVYTQCLTGAATAEGTNLVLKGTSSILAQILATKSANSNITIGN